MIHLYQIKLPACVICEPTDGSSHIDVDHLDGMYSFGKTEKGAIVHLSVGTPLVANADGTWRISESEQPDEGERR